MAKVVEGHPERPEGTAGRAMLERMNAGHHEELANWGLDHIQIAPDAQMLDIGCGGGANLQRLLALAPAGHATGIDYAPLSVEMSREVNAEAIKAGRCDVLEGDVRALPFGDGAFDLVTAFETVYFWDMAAGFAEAHRVLRSGGQFLICNEANGTGAEAQEVADGIPGMVIPTAADLVGLLEGAGFPIIQVYDEAPEGGERITVVAVKM